MNTTYQTRRERITQNYQALIQTPNQVNPDWSNGWYERWKHPVLTAAHVPPHWRYDYNPETNPHFLERLGINAICNPGAIEMDGKFLLVGRVEGFDRKSFFAVAESPNGVDQFEFWDEPILMPETEDPDTNPYDMRLVRHEDGWIYGLFCTERKDPNAKPGDLSSAVAQCGIAKTKDLKTWTRLPDLKTNSAQQRNVVLHPEFVDGQYAFYTRPQDGFIDAGNGGGIGWGLCKDIENAVIDEESIINERAYHTIKESKNGQGPAPIKTEHGWLHIAHGVRGCAAGLRYVIYGFITALDEPWRMTHNPGGYLLAPEGEERIGDVSNVAFTNGVIARDNGEIYLYYASSDTRCHVATTTVERLTDVLMHTPEDPLRSAACVEQRLELIRTNQQFL